MAPYHFDLLEITIRMGHAHRYDTYDTYTHCSSRNAESVYHFD